MWSGQILAIFNAIFTPFCRQSLISMVSYIYVEKYFNIRYEMLLLHWAFALVIHKTLSFPPGTTTNIDVFVDISEMHTFTALNLRRIGKIAHYRNS